MPQPKGPTTEVGGPGGFLPGGSGIARWSTFEQSEEHVLDLRWPASVRMYQRMRADSQVEALYGGIALPLLDYVWWVKLPPEVEASPELTAYAEALAADLGLPLGEPADDEWEPPGPGLYRFSFLEHLSDALLALLFGHHYFEQVGEVDGALWRLRKLAPRHPLTIDGFDVAPDGGLRAIRQGGIVQTARGGYTIGAAVPPISVDRLVAYVWQGDSQSRWIGRSMLRAMYREWLVKDRLIRVDAINHERAGGVPYVTTDETYQGTNLKDLQEIASAFRVGEDGGAALPPGADLKLAKVVGTDVVASMRYLDESMARRWQGMVRQLGQTQTGSRALGSTFDDIEDAARRAIARWFRLTFREHVIEDWWNWNVPPGPDGQTPPHPSLATRPPQSSGGALPSSPPGSGVPASTNGGASQEGASPPSPAAALRHRSPRAVGALSLPARNLRRQPNEGELAAAVDFATMDIAHEAAANALHSWFEGQALPEQIAAIGDAIVATKDGTTRTRITRADMARLQAPVMGADRIAELLLPVAREGARGALAEAAAQGVVAEMPTDAVLAKAVADHAQAMASQLASGLSVAAQRKAVQLATGRAPTEVAAGVTSYLEGLKHQWERDQLQGAAQMALNNGRFAVMDRVPGNVPRTYQASELLDENTCDPCAAVDGEEFTSLDQVMEFYGSGGYIDCEGGPRCRGTAVAIYEEF